MAKKKENVKKEVLENSQELEVQTAVFRGTLEDICADDTVVENLYQEETAEEVE